MEKENVITLPGWKIVRPIGLGTFGKVFEIEKEDEFNGGVHSALKVISIPESMAEIMSYRDDGYDDESLTKLFRSRVEDITAEFRLMNRLKGNSHIVSYEDHSTVQHDNDPGYDIFIRMELLTPLPGFLDKLNHTESAIEQATARVGADICSALELCRRHSIIHRDIKPQNVLVNDDGNFKLGDFGVAKVLDHTTKATKAGTYGYMAPEVYFGKEYDARIDLYSLGLVLYWMLNERRGPFLPLPPTVPKSSQNEQALDRRMSGEPLPTPKHGSDELVRIVLKACAFDPKDRYADSAEMKRDLEALISTEKAIFVPPAEAQASAALEQPETPDEKSVGIFIPKADPNADLIEREYAPEKLSEETIRTEIIPPAEKQTADEMQQPEDSDEKTIGIFWNRKECDEPKKSSEEENPKKEKPVPVEQNHQTSADSEKQETSEKIPTMPKKKSNKKIWISLIALLIALALAAAAIVLLLTTCDSCKANQETVAESAQHEEPDLELNEEPTPTTTPTSTPTPTPTTTPTSTPTPTPEVSYEEEAYGEALSLYAEGEYRQAIPLFVELWDYEDSHRYLMECWNKVAIRETIASGNHTVGLQTDGTVIAIGDNEYGQCDVSDWSDIIAISARDFHTVGLKADGTVVAAGDNEYGQCDVSDWSDIIAISAGDFHTVGLKADGTVVAVGEDASGQTRVSDWTDIVAISAGSWHTVGLKADGTVVAAGYNVDGQCDVSDWRDIIAISAAAWHTVGLKADGTAVAAGHKGYGACYVSDWSDIIAISAGNFHTVGLKADGTVVAAGHNVDGQCDVSDWRDIIAISTAAWHTVGLKADGTVVAAGYNRDGQCDVSDWRDIQLPNK